MTIPVTGEAVCRHCLKHLPLMAKKTGLQFLTVFDKEGKIVYYWRPGLGDMEVLGRLLADKKEIFMSMRLLCNGKVIEDATWADVEAVLPELKNEAFFDLAIRPEPESGPDGLEVQSEDGNYLLVLGIANTGELREIENLEGIGKEVVSIGGYSYDPTRV